MEQLKFALPMADASQVVVALRDRDIDADISPETHDETAVITMDCDPEAADRVREAVRAVAPDSHEVTDG